MYTYKRYRHAMYMFLCVHELFGDVAPVGARVQVA